MSQAENNVGHLIIPQDKVPTSAYQAIYHKLTSKVEKLSETFDDIYCVDINAIVHLNTMLCQITKQYPVQSQNSRCSISFHKDEALSVSSIEKLQTINFSTQKPTEAIEYNFDFFSVLPVEIKEAQDIVQRFKVTVKIDQDFVDEVTGIPWAMRSLMSGQNITLQIEYSDYAVGRSLQVCVQDWVKSLNGKPLPKFIKFAEMKSDFAAYAVPYSFAIASLFGQSIFAKSQDSVGAGFLLSSMALAVLMLLLGKILVVNFYRQLALSKPLTFICITAGDVLRKQRILKERSTKNAVLLFIFATIVVGILINVFSSYIWDQLKG